MPRPTRSTVNDPYSVLRSLALSCPKTKEGIACAGTALEKRTIKVRGKAFLFLGGKDATLKLADSLPQATQLARQQPQQCEEEIPKEGGSVEECGGSDEITLIPCKKRTWPALPADFPARFSQP
jgi:hypothetical protein